MAWDEAGGERYLCQLSESRHPQYCWREEQPLQEALLGSYLGDMPHNWASAECIRYMRHILALEDGPHLRLLAGITWDQLAPGQPYRLAGTPTRFGQVDVDLEPLDGKQGWRLRFPSGRRTVAGHRFCSNYVRQPISSGHSRRTSAGNGAKISRPSIRPSDSGPCYEA